MRTNYVFPFPPGVQCSQKVNMIVNLLGFAIFVAAVVTVFAYGYVAPTAVHVP